MSDLPEGALLTSINGKKCTAIPRNVTNPEDIVTATDSLAADPTEDATGQLPPGGILMQAPGPSREFPSYSPAIISSISEPEAESTDTQPDAAATSVPPGFRPAPDDDDEVVEEKVDGEVEDPTPTEASDTLPSETPVIGELFSGEDGVDEDAVSATSEGSAEETETPKESTAEEGSEEEEESSIPTSAQRVVEDGVTRTVSNPQSTNSVDSGTGGSGNDANDSEEAEGDDNGNDNTDGSNRSGSSDDNESEGGESSSDGDSDSEDSDDADDSDNRNGSDDNTDDDGGSSNGEDDDGDEEDGFGGAGSIPSGTGDSFITSTLEGGAITTIPAPSGNGQGSPTNGADTDVVGSSNDNGDESRQAGIIAGSVVGSLAAVALIGFLLFWFWRKRVQRHKYVIQTPVFEPPNSSRTEKTWDFDNGSIGPTNKSARMKEAVEYRFDAIGRKFNKASPQPSRKSTIKGRGNSQFFAAGALPPPRSRDNPDIHPEDDELSNQDRLGNWWSRVREDANFNWGVRNEGAPEMTDRAGPVDPSRIYGQRASEGQDFSGALGLMINDARSRGNDPFSDDYAFNDPGPSQGYAINQTPPLRNPFDDGNSIQPLPLAATSYDPRGQQRRSTTGSLHRQTSSPLRQQTASPYQRSDTTTPLSRGQNSTPLSRGAVRSDQFDLEISEPHPGTLVSMPEEVTTREGTREGSLRSFTSQVSSLTDWDNNSGAPKGDVGAAALRWADEKSPGIGKAR